MRWQLAAWFLLSLAAPALGADLSTLDRTIVQEPVYRHRPRYCLLAFGPQAKQRVWLVLDGDTLYVDKNGNGDLTETGERQAVSRVRRDEQPAVSEVRTYYERIPLDKLNDRVLPAPPKSARAVWFFVERYVPNDAFHPKTPDEAELQRRLARGLIRVGFLFDGEFGQTGQAVCADRPADAPVLRFDGPRTLAVSSGSLFQSGKQLPALRRDEVNDLIVHLVTPGLGAGSLTVWDNAYVPTDVHPVADCEFPSRQPGGKPIRLRVPLTGRC